MPFHQAVQDILLWGHRAPLAPPPAAVPPPPELVPLVTAVEAEHAVLNAEAIHAGHRYRSAFWALYLLSAVAVLLAVMPVALGWTSADHPRHGYAVGWGVLEVMAMAGAWLCYRQGRRNNWQGAWLASRSRAERVWYLPLTASLRTAGPAPADKDWYEQVFSTGSKDETVVAVCSRLNPTATKAFDGAWQRPAFIQGFGAWLRWLLADQRHYHQRLTARHEALQHRIHRITAGFFFLSALGAALHLFWHADPLLIATTAFPALGAALHGALVQGESHRLAETSRKLDQRLAKLDEQIAQALAEPGQDAAHQAHAIQNLTTAALNLILQEQQDWHHLVRPHDLPLG